jgi:Zn-dependent M28 family amino/carboxypeptidase
MAPVISPGCTGADDNGSGSASVLEFARVISESGATFAHTLRLCLFTGEEQGLIGSRALAAQYANEGLDVIAMFVSNCFRRAVLAMLLTVIFSDSVCPCYKLSKRLQRTPT